MKKQKIIAKNIKNGTKYVFLKKYQDFPGVYEVKSVNGHGKYLVNRTSVKIIK